MFTKLFQKPIESSQHNVPPGSIISTDLEPRVVVHYGIPSTASILAFDPIQHLLAIGTLDGRIKVIGGDNIEALLISTKSLPFKHLEFLQNQGFLVSVSNENEIQVWDLENRFIASNLQWESNITAFSVICGTHYMYVGDEYGFLSVLKYDAEGGEILQLPYQITANILAEAAGISFPNHQSIVGVLPQPCSSWNRVLIAFENGLIILWDVAEDRAVLMRGYKDLQLTDTTIVHSPNGGNHEHENDTSDHEQAEKEISSLCWVSSDGSILAVGYVDGDILLWNLSITASTKDKQAQKSSSNVVKLQLSSDNRRLPVILLQWSASRAHNGRGGLLFIYGGDQIGSEEVLTILTLDWSSGIETLKCVDRSDLTLSGSFADMILASDVCAGESSDATSLFVLTNPGELHFYDNACLSDLKSEKKHFVCEVQYPAVIPTVEPHMTLGRLYLVHAEGSFSRVISETVSAAKLRVAHNMTAGSTKWPLTGGVPSQVSFDEDNKIGRIYVAGYQDGSVRIWDATFPVLSLMFVLGYEVEGIDVAGASSSISALDFSSTTFSLAIGNEYGLVHLYRLVGSSGETSLHYVTETKHEVHNLSPGSGFQCMAVFFLLNSPVCTVKYVTSGVRLAVGFESGQVAMLDISSLSVLFLTRSVSSSNSAIISLSVKTFAETCGNSQNHTESETSIESAKEFAVVLTRDAHIHLMDSTTGNITSSQHMNPMKESTAIALYILEDNTSVAEASEKHSLIGSLDLEAKIQPVQINAQGQNAAADMEYDPSIQATHLGHIFMDSLILLCCEDALLLYSSKSLIQGGNFISKVNLVKPCCWTSIFKKDEKECGLIIVYQTGVIEIRCFPDLEVVGETSLMSMLRWNFKTNMDKTMSSSEKGQIVLVNGCEFAFISLLAFENDFRIPEALPCLHDKVLAAAADTALSFSENLKKKKSTAPGIFGGIIKGFKGGKAEHGVDLTATCETIVTRLEGIFSRFPFSDLHTDVTNDQEVEFNIDDIEIDEPLPVSSSSFKSNNGRTDNETERERLFESGSTDTKPRLRTREEIIAKYAKAGDASSAAARARDRLAERQEKLENIGRRTEELQSGAENFASMANELVKTMENRKWWKL